MNVQAGKRYTLIKETKQTVTNFKVTVNWVEDRGDFFYIGYTPDDFRICRWGTCKIKKNGKYKAINYKFIEA